jgi:hypothetical protein
MLKLAGEILTGEPMESYSNVHMERGKEQEAEAREAYELMKDVDCSRSASSSTATRAVRRIP